MGAQQCGIVAQIAGARKLVVRLPSSMAKMNAGSTVHNLWTWFTAYPSIRLVTTIMAQKSPWWATQCRWLTATLANGRHHR